MGISVFGEEPFTVRIEKNTANKEMADEQLKYARQRIERGYSEQDVLDINHWFLTLIPEMLEEYKKNRNGSPGCLGENYTDSKGCLVNDKCHKEWDKILERMIFLFRESQEETCSKQNEYQEEHLKAFQAFEKEYGLLGEKLATPIEKEKNKRLHVTTVHFMSEVSQYSEIDRKYKERDNELAQYREDCRKEAMTLFSEWLPCLWD